MTLYTGLALILVVAGVVLLATVAYLARLVRRHRRSLRALLKLAQTGLQPLQLPALAWPALSEGGIIRLEYSGFWFGQPVQGNYGALQAGSAASPFSFDIAADKDISLHFRLHTAAAHGEARLFAENLSGVLRLLMETSVHSKMEALSAALAEQARLTLYLQHDLRNLAQWVEWLNADFIEAQDNASLLAIAQRLKYSSPHAALRARHILDATFRPGRPPEPEAVALGYAIRQSAEHAGINIAIKHDACVLLRRDLLDRTLDNLFTNVAPLLRRHAGHLIAVTISQEANRVTARIHMPRLPETAKLPPEHLFEPFASGRPGGLGLGLYQARKSLMEGGGELAAELCGDDICFTMHLPGTV